MKHLLLSLTLILSANAWADDEFPIELTCEVASEIWYFYFEEQKENSWYKPHESNPNFGGAGNWKNYKGKQNEFKFEYEINDKFIAFELGNWSATTNGYNINRYSLGIRDIIHDSGGQCYKGFKEYEKQI